TGAAMADEDETDLSKVGMSLEMFERMVRGYMDAARDFLTPLEIDYLAFSAKLMTFECGMRFLADYLNGDIYFKVRRENHNLDRCRTQFAMVADMERKMGRMRDIVYSYA
ncbi:MAG: mucin desulfatase, partial [Armatimonadetes bacterium]|nr:mucin desulfatase [Armatimonadota bacterium]